MKLPDYYYSTVLQYIKLAKPDPSSPFFVRPGPTRGSNLKARPDPSSILKSSARLELEKSRLDNNSNATPICFFPEVHLHKKTQLICHCLFRRRRKRKQFRNSAAYLSPEERSLCISHRTQGPLGKTHLNCKEDIIDFPPRHYFNSVLF